MLWEWLGARQAAMWVQPGCHHQAMWLHRQARREGVPHRLCGLGGSVFFFLAQIGGSVLEVCFSCLNLVPIDSDCVC